MASNDKFTFFWSQESPLSNDHMSEFTIDGLRFNCNEHYIMYRKAKLFGNNELAEKIMNEKDPKKQKSLGRDISGYDSKKWHEHRMEIVKTGALAKFRQNPKMLKALLSTGDTELVEASPVDKIWGIGLSESDPLALNKSTWKGENLLGQILTQVRNELRNEQRNVK